MCSIPEADDDMEGMRAGKRVGYCRICYRKDRKGNKAEKTRGDIDIQTQSEADRYVSCLSLNIICDLSK